MCRVLPPRDRKLAILLIDDRQMFELPVVIGQYQAVAYYQNALRLRLHHDNPGLAAR